MAFSNNGGGTVAIEVPDNKPLFDVQAHTVTGWVRVDLAFVITWVMDATDDHNDCRFRFFWNGTDLRHRLLRTGGTGGGINHDEAWAAVAGTWNHVAATWDTVDSVIYLNGLSIGSLNTAGVLDTNAGARPLTLCNVGGAHGRPMRGMEADVRFYNRALSAAEIQTLYGCQGRDGIINGIIARWPFVSGVPGAAPAAGAVQDVGPNLQAGSPEGAGGDFAYAAWRYPLRRRAG